MKSVHEGIHFNCDQCEYKSTVDNYHNRHRKSLHEVCSYLLHLGRHFICNQCDNKSIVNDNHSGSRKLFH